MVVSILILRSRLHTLATKASEWNCVLVTSRDSGHRQVHVLLAEGEEAAYDEGGDVERDVLLQLPGVLQLHGSPERDSEGEAVPGGQADDSRLCFV